MQLHLRIVIRRLLTQYKLLDVIKIKAVSSASASRGVWTFTYKEVNTAFDIQSLLLSRIIESSQSRLEPEAILIKPIVKVKHKILIIYLFSARLG